MTKQLEIQTALANEARRQELKSKVANLRGAMSATASAVQRLSTLNSDAQVQLDRATTELTALEAGAGPGITADFGTKSSVTRFLEVERLAAKEAAIDFVKANPECTEVETAAVWDAAAIGSHPLLPFAIQGGLAMGRLYQLNLVTVGLTAEASWDAQRAWILQTPRELILQA